MGRAACLQSREACRSAPGFSKNLDDPDLLLSGATCFFAFRQKARSSLSYPTTTRTALKHKRRPRAAFSTTSTAGWPCPGPSALHYTVVSPFFSRKPVSPVYFGDFRLDQQTSEAAAARWRQARWTTRRPHDKTIVAARRASSRRWEGLSKVELRSRQEQARFVSERRDAFFWNMSTRDATTIGAIHVTGDLGATDQNQPSRPRNGTLNALFVKGVFWCITPNKTERHRRATLQLLYIQHNITQHKARAASK